ncbi:MAG: AAA family ATPase [Verrucomicrobiota bacterium]
MNLIIPFDPATMSVPLPSPASRAAATPATTRPGPAWDVTELGPLPASGTLLPDIAEGSVNGCELMDLTLTPRPAVLGAWMRQGDLGYLFAPRGAGKSWMAMLIARAVATGQPLGEWPAGQAALPVCYFDAEMNLPDVQARVRSIGLAVPRFHLISNELLFQRHGRGINIACPTYQAALTRYLPDGCLFIIDNLSTSQLGMAENDNDAFDDIRDWLLALRHRAITVLIVHHAGRNGLMRGSSRREDMAHWILSLKGCDDDDLQHKTAFTTTFTKCRNCTGAEARPLFWTLDTRSTPLTLLCSNNEDRDVLLDHIRNGVTRAGDLAELMEVACGTISRHAAKLERLGLITIRNREYHAVD